MTASLIVARRIRVAGIVQGVGFRPFVWHLAQELNLNGWVRNDADGLNIAVEGSAGQIAEMLQRLRIDAPPLARVDSVQVDMVTPSGLGEFVIAESAGGLTTTAIGPDMGVCADCLSELFDPSSRRWRHAFITCTHCGPRYSVTRALPYDRRQTSLAPFPLCASCAAEYSNPADRRFHAETICCLACGPMLSLRDGQGNKVAGDPIARTLKLLQSGAIVAIKGLGGFHLACDALNAKAVAQLRERKNREAKPFAVIMANVASLAPFVRISPQECALLETRERPIVLLRTHSDSDTVLPGVAPELLLLGVMLPTTPIHYLLFHEAAGRPAGTDWLTEPQDMVLVMTSANPGDEPIVSDNAEARRRLADIADAYLDHNRGIAARCDDSVLRHAGDAPQFIRRSRGYTPAAIRLPRHGPAVLAFGAHLKNAICVTRGDEAFLSPHIGDLETTATCGFLDETVERMLTLFELKPAIVAHDLHPDYYSTRAAVDFAARHGLPLVAVQHHHAHIAAVCAENRHVGPLIGLALDGVGLGLDGKAWGGELLLVDGARFERLGHLRPLPLPGADRAAREPWRVAAAVLHEVGRAAEISQRFRQAGAGTIADMLQRQVNCPRTSSMGRVFDAASGLLGLCTHMRFEAQAAIFVEQAASRFIANHGQPPAMTDGWKLGRDGQLDLLPILSTLKGDGDVDLAAARFHVTLIAAMTEWVMQAVEASGLKTVACGGGCFHNDILSTGLWQNLRQHGIRVLVPVQVPPGDAGIGIGQAWVAMHSLEN